MFYCDSTLAGMDGMVYMLDLYFVSNYRKIAVVAMDRERSVLTKTSFELSSSSPLLGNEQRRSSMCRR